MSLYLVDSIDNPWGYSLWPGYLPGHPPDWVWDKYNPHLHTPPRIYQESVTALIGFCYIPPPRDIFVLWVMGEQTLWPGWFTSTLHFSAQTGELIERISGASVFGFAYTNSVEWGDLGHLYATRNETTDCFQINWQNFNSEASQWRITPYSWTPKRIFSHILVNKTEDRVLGVTYPSLEVWDKAVTGPQSLIWSQRLPATVKDLAYESNEYGWVLLTDRQVLKLDWGNKFRVEMASSLQPYPTTEKGMALAFDSFRRRLAVYRWLPDATDGAARNCIEFYETVPKAIQLTEPVPVTRHQAGDFVKFKSNLVGDMGEGFAGGIGQVSLVAPNNHGRVLSHSVISGIIGDFNISYQAPTEPATDTIQITYEPTEVFS